MLSSTSIRFLIKIISQRLHFLLSLGSENSESFDERIFKIENIFNDDDEPLNAKISALDDLQSAFPFPKIQFIPRGVWPYQPYYHLSVQTHLKSAFMDAVNLLKATGRTVSEIDEKYLHLLLTHHCGWSATYSNHIDDSWVKFFHIQYPQLKGLVPILDSMTYVEELAYFPDGYSFRHPRFFLLATHNSYFVYDATDGEEALFCAGETLEDVYNGMKDLRWADSSDDPWDVVKIEKYLPPSDYFFHYFLKENGNFGVSDFGGGARSEEYPGKVRRGLLRRMSDMIFQMLRS